MAKKRKNFRCNKGDHRELAAAYGAMLCRPEIVALYPITPQTEVVEEMSRFQAEGLLDAEMVEVEGENSAMNIITAASVAGARVFTATSSYGLVFMYDALLQAAGYRVPAVMVNANRETPGITAVSSGQQDMISTRDSGWYPDRRLQLPGSARLRHHGLPDGGGFGGAAPGDGEL